MLPDTASSLGWGRTTTAMSKKNIYYHHHTTPGRHSIWSDRLFSPFSTERKMTFHSLMSLLVVFSQMKANLRTHSATWCIFGIKQSLFTMILLPNLHSTHRTVEWGKPNMSIFTHAWGTTQRSALPAEKWGNRGGKPPEEQSSAGKASWRGDRVSGTS